MQCTNNNIKIGLLTFSINSTSFLRKVKSSYKCAVFAFCVLILPYASDMMLEEEEEGGRRRSFSSSLITHITMAVLVLVVKRRIRPPSSFPLLPRNRISVSE